MSDDGSSVDVSPAVAETHSGVVFLLGDRAYKLKKPLDLGFLDFTTREARQAVCRREVELNRRLAPDVYLGVADVTGTSGELCDHLVVMRRMPSSRRLSTLVTAGVDVDDQVDAVARTMASFHGRAERCPAADAAAAAAAAAGRWAANTAVLRKEAGRLVPAEDVERVDALAARYLAGRSELFEQRVLAGRACDGHGDLLADDIFCLDDGPRILDCIEFDDELRYGDGLADVAFLAMDLEHLGRPDLGTRLLEVYRAAAGDEWPASLAHHHIAYRAQVRAKVATIRAGQGGEGAGEEAERRLTLARRHLEAARVRLVLVGGLPGTGKSTLAAGIGRALGAVVLRTDEVRKELAGLPATQPAGAAYGEGIYRAEHTAAAYREALARAGSALRSGETVVLDASWSQARHRGWARETGAGTNSDVVELRCDAPVEVTSARLLARARQGGDASDADPAIGAAMASDRDPWPEATTVDTAADPRAALDLALAAVSSLQ
ncbi:MAG TPA: AAA family ATPase [Acidimicrobiales bacterium]|nr:AAA family ATPase [Acidimicrobiales bacterium]